ncbi:SPOR domain-containing protein [Persephonella sp.]
MRQLNEHNWEIFLILKILLKDHNQTGFLYGKDGRKVSLFLMDLFNEFNTDKRVLFISPESGNIYKQILEKLGKNVENFSKEKFLIEFFTEKEKLKKRLFIVIESSEKLSEKDIVELLKILGREKDITLIFAGNEKLKNLIDQIKTKKIFSSVHFVFQLKDEKRLFLSKKILFGILLTAAAFAVWLLYQRDVKVEEEKKLQIVQKDVQIVKKLKEESEEKPAKSINIEQRKLKKSYESVCDFICEFDKAVYTLLKNENIPPLNHKKLSISEKYRIYAGAFRKIENARYFQKEIKEKTDLSPEIEDLGKIKNVYIKAYSREEALQIRDMLNEIGIKPYIKRLTE